MGSVIVDSSVHAQLDEPKSQRRALLECALDTTKLLQRYKHYRSIVEEKHKQQGVFKELVGEIHELFSSLEVKDLPQYKIEKTVPKTEKPVIVQKIPRDKLAEELEAISEKLRNL